MRDYFGVVFYLNLSANFLMDCNLAPLMDANGAFGDELEMFSIRSSTTFIYPY